MHLQEWLRTDERSREELAKIVGVHYATFSRWVSGRGVPSKRHAIKIRELTNGQVTLWDLNHPQQKE
jgi:DNA-binding transcriptional regulator YdaS (Cro superfamily)